MLKYLAQLQVLLNHTVLVIVVSNITPVIYLTLQNACTATIKPIRLACKQHSFISRQKWQQQIARTNPASLASTGDAAAAAEQSCSLKPPAPCNPKALHFQTLLSAFHSHANSVRVLMQPGSSCWIQERTLQHRFAGFNKIVEQSRAPCSPVAPDCSSLACMHALQSADARHSG